MTPHDRGWSTPWPRALLAALSVAVTLNAATSLPPEPVEIGFEPQLLVDDYLVANRWAVRFKNEEVVHRFHTPARHSANPLMSGDCGYVNVVRDEEAGRFRMWYQTWCAQWRDNPKHPKYAVAYAESEAGLTWRRPELGLFEWKGSKQNNVCWLGDRVGGASGASIVHAPVEHRRGFKYLLLYSTSNGLNLVGSRDGIHWDAESVTRIKYLHSDTMNNVVYDPKRDRFIAYCRPRYVFRGWIDPRDTGATRRVAYLTSKELWTLWEADPTTTLIPDRLDTDQDFNFFYGMPVTHYGGVFLGCLWPFKLNTDIYTELVISRDGVSFDRLPGRPRLLDLGEPGAWDDGMVFGTRWVEVGREWWLYYAGHDGPHGSKTRAAGIGLATIRKEGFVSLHGPAQDGGMVCTRVLHWPGGDLVINAETGGKSGRLCVRVLTPHREVVDGFSYAACGDLSGDSTGHRVTWAGRSMHELVGQDLRLEFFLEDADLYSFRACLPGTQTGDPQMSSADSRAVPGFRLLKRGKKGKSAAQVAEDTAHHVRKVYGVLQRVRGRNPRTRGKQGNPLAQSEGAEAGRLQTDLQSASLQRN